MSALSKNVNKCMSQMLNYSFNVVTNTARVSSYSSVSRRQADAQGVNLCPLCNCDASYIHLDFSICRKTCKVFPHTAEHADDKGTGIMTLTDPKHKQIFTVIHCFIYKKHVFKTL